jgi:hypothetical protein
MSELAEEDTDFLQKLFDIPLLPPILCPHPKILQKLLQPRILVRQSSHISLATPFLSNEASSKENLPQTSQ